MTQATSELKVEGRAKLSQKICGFEQGDYPYAKLMGRRAYEAEKAAFLLPGR